MTTDRWYDDEAERAVLGAVLIRNAAYDDVAGLLDPGHFRRVLHQQAWRAMMRLASRGEPVDLLTLRSELGRLDVTVHPAELSGLTDGVPRSTNAVAYATRVRDRALSARLWALGQDLVSRAEQAVDTGAELLENAEGVLDGLRQKATANEWVTADQLAAGACDQIVAAREAPGHVSGVPTGFADLDEVTRGWQPGDLIILGARPSMGKTALALQMAAVAAHEAPVGFFSVEMGAHPLAMRLLASEARVDGFRAVKGYLSTEEYDRAMGAMVGMAQLKLHVLDTPTLSPLTVRSEARRLRARVGGLGLVVVDYLQLLGPMPGDQRENLTVKLENITWALKQLARDLRVPVMALSQLNRAVDRSADKRPTLSDLRSSGGIEQTADVVLLLHRPGYYDDQMNDAETELIIAKQRNGPVGTIPLYFQKAQTRFESMTRRT